MKIVFNLIIFWCITFQTARALPPIQHYQKSDKTPFVLKAKGQITYPYEDGWLKESAILLGEQLSKRGLKWSVDTKPTEDGAVTSIHLLPLENSKKIPYNVNDRRFNETYRIEVGSDLKIFASGKAGAVYAVQRLLDLLLEENQLNSGIIIDYPDYRWRGAIISLKHTPCGDPVKFKNSDTSDWLECMDLELEKLAAMRFNLLGLRSRIFHRLNDGDMALLSQLFKLARSYNLEPMPHVGSKLWDIPKESLNVNAIEGIYHKNVSFRVQNNQLVSQEPHDNLIANGDFELKKSGFWHFSNKPWAPAWQLTSESDATGKPNRFLTIRLPVDNKPWQSRAAPLFRNNSQLIPVAPGEYYELGISTRSQAERKTIIRIHVEQYDRNQKMIKGLTHYFSKLGARKMWQHHWIPIFIAKNAHYASIRLVPKNRSAAEGTLDVDNVELHLMRNTLVNVLNNKETSPVLVSEDGTMAYTHGKDYHLSLSKIQEWYDKRFRELENGIIRIPPNSRIEDGQNIRINFDTLPLEYSSIPRSKYSPASGYTYEEYKRIFNSLKNLSPLFIHICMDEHLGGLNRDSRSQRLGWSNRKLFFSYLNALNNLLQKEGEIEFPGSHRSKGLGAANTNLVVWDDMLNPRHNGGENLFQIPFGGPEGDTSLIQGRNDDPALSPKLFLSSWWYSGNDKKGVIKFTPNQYSKMGYRYFVSPWYEKSAIYKWAESANPRLAEGLLATTWDGRTQGLALTACVGWNVAGCRKSDSPDR